MAVDLKTQPNILQANFDENPSSSSTVRDAYFPIPPEDANYMEKLIFFITHFPVYVWLLWLWLCRLPKSLYEIIVILYKMACISYTYPNFSRNAAWMGYKALLITARYKLWNFTGLTKKPAMAARIVPEPTTIVKIVKGIEAFKSKISGSSSDDSSNAMDSPKVKLPAKEVAKEKSSFWAALGKDLKKFINNVQPNDAKTKEETMEKPKKVEGRRNNVLSNNNQKDNSAPKRKTEKSEGTTTTEVTYFLDAALPHKKKE